MNFIGGTKKQDSIDTDDEDAEGADDLEKELEKELDGFEVGIGSKKTAKKVIFGS